MSKFISAQSLRRLLVASIGSALAGTAVWSVAGTVATGSSLAFGSSHFISKPQVDPANGPKARLSGVHVAAGKAPRLVKAAPQLFQTASLAAGSEKSARHLHLEPVAAPDGNAARFDAVVMHAGVTSEKLARLFPRSNSARPQGATAASGAPAQQRFASPPAGVTDGHQILLAYADPSPAGATGAALSTLLAVPSEEDLATAQAPDPETEAAAAVPVYEDTPVNAPVPQFRPKEARKPVAGAENTDHQQVDEPKADKRETAKPQRLAYARPNDPAEKKSSGSLGQALRNLFGGGTRAGNGVAVYDISAAKVYMPDGSVLEAHSGVGNMADNPRYVHVQMTGPTPPHTYNLQMRESRFHGVQAIRMLPVDGKNKYGRDGFLTHSYLLRGRQAQSHGCVAFKDYERFLTAFKQGKVRQMVVVPSGGRESFRLASNGKSV